MLGMLFLQYYWKTNHIEMSFLSYPTYNMMSSCIFIQLPVWRSDDVVYVLSTSAWYSQWQEAITYIIQYVSR